MKPEDADMLKILVKARSGVVINAANSYQLETSLTGVARREGCASPDELLARLRGGRDERLMWAVTEALTPSDTAFFRDPAVFDLLAREVLPRFAGPRSAPVRLWSAACSTGQEAWSLAMTVEDNRAALGGARFELYGSDISEGALARARTAAYSQFEVQRGLPIRQLLRHFEKRDETWRVAPALIPQVRWRRISLLSDLTPLGRFEVIFARNVVRYFDWSTRRRVLDQLGGLLTDDGVLFLGLDEAMEEIEGLHPILPGSGVYSRAAPGQAKAA